MPECQNCQTMWSHDYVRVYGDNNDQLHHCPDCASATAVKQGNGAKP